MCETQKRTARTTYQNLNSEILFASVCYRGKKKQGEREGEREKGERKSSSGRKTERFERDCQNVAGGNVSREVKRSQTEREQEVETIISVSESP